MTYHLHKLLLYNVCYCGIKFKILKAIIQIFFTEMMYFKIVYLSEN